MEPEVHRGRHARGRQTRGQQVRERDGMEATPRLHAGELRTDELRTSACGLRSPVVVPRLNVGKRGGVPGTFYHDASDGAAGRLARAYAGAALGGLPLPQSMQALELVLRQELAGSPQNLSFFVGPASTESEGIDGAYLVGRQDDGESGGNSRGWGTDFWQPVLTPAVAYVSCYRPWVVPAERLVALVEPVVGEDLAAHLLRYAAGALYPFMPAWDAEWALDFIRCYYWYGEEDDAVRREEIRDDIARHLRKPVEEVTDEEVDRESEGMFWTSDYVASRLKPAYSAARNASETEIDALSACDHPEAGPAIRRVLSAATRCRRLTEALSSRYPFGFDDDLMQTPFALVLTTDGEPGWEEDAGPYEAGDSLIRETFEENARYYAEQGCDPGPTCGMGFDPDDPEGVPALREFVRSARVVGKACLAVVEAVSAGALGGSAPPVGLPSGTLSGESADELARSALALSAPVAEEFLSGEAVGAAGALARLTRKAGTAEAVPGNLVTLY